MIPKVLHQLWIGPRAAPARWMRTWQQMDPDLTYRLWDDRSVDTFGLRNLETYRRFYEAGMFDGAADVARIEILQRFGGVYADADSIALRPLGDARFMQAGFFAAREPNEDHPDLVSNAFMGAIADHPILTSYVAALADVKHLRPFRASGPLALTEIVRSHQGADVSILPAWTFFPTSLSGDVQRGGRPFARHFWSTTAERWGEEHAVPYPSGG